MGKMRDSDNVFSRRDWNRFVEVADWYHRQKALGEISNQNRRTHDSNVVTVKNSSGGNLPMGSVVEFTDYLLNDNELGQRMVRMDGATPDLSHPCWGILNLPLKAGERGAAQVSGVTVARVNVTSTSHTHADVASGETHLVSGTSGPVVILDNGGSTGTKLCPVVIDRGGARIWLTKADANVASGNSGTFSIWSGTAGSESDTTENLTAYNRTGLQIDSGTWAKVTEINGQKYAEPWQCPA